MINLKIDPEFQNQVFNFLHGLCPPFRVPPASGQYDPKL